jgi:hypothetical protein
MAGAPCDEVSRPYCPAVIGMVRLQSNLEKGNVMSNAEIARLEQDALNVDLRVLSGEVSACMQAPECTDHSVGGGGPDLT